MAPSERGENCGAARAGCSGCPRALTKGPPAQPGVEAKPLPCLAGRLVTVEPAFRKAEPGKLCVQQGDGCGRGFLGRRAPRDGWGWRRQQGAAGALVAPEGSTATRAEAAALQEGFVEQDV